jgi:beta-1,4-N-acetylglucosaminyltransferase
LIFVTVGTHHQAFDRLIDALTSLPTQDLVVQYGHGPPPVAALSATAFLSFEEMLDRFHEADVVVTHGGVGSILSALRAGHTPLVVPRLKRFGEHVDDHQVELADALASERLVIPVWNTSKLPAALGMVPAKGASKRPRAFGLHQAVRKALR